MELILILKKMLFEMEYKVDFLDKKSFINE